MEKIILAWYMELITKYFPQLNDLQKQQFEALDALYREWNDQINVISRKDIDNLYLHHVLHALSVAKHLRFVPGAEILDLGTGGGFPGIPLAILFPETRFTLIDGTKKKIRVVEAVVQALQLENVDPQASRAEDIRHKYDFVTTRGVATLDKLAAWSRPLIKSKHQHAIPNGILALKGGDIRTERALLPKKAYLEYYPLSDYFEEDYFKEKWLIYLQA
ncbi:MAG TPA: 16S rRNA (guanine(527)-N(7))-methyltransferase RsmG [Saprospiraceae bacterium]|nr:16S rRNA (guanine(527)-N(7))-methyltransferase RsmG [Saprospiraceae bacterium]HMQ83798.1 16S rRNA (guanine(527)-N(7))-methyltransferase RsmG [Saprospiraceae bacterium]